MIRYKIRKVGRTWRLYHSHGFNDGWHQVMESSYWTWCAWVATGDPTYRKPGFLLMPSICSSGGTRT